MEGYKRCRVCGIYKPIDKFVKCKKSPDGRTNRCKPCKNYHQREARKDNMIMKKYEIELSKQLLQYMGYDTNSDIPVHEQFSIKHNLKK